MCGAATSFRGSPRLRRTAHLRAVESYILLQVNRECVKAYTVQYCITLKQWAHKLPSSTKEEERVGDSRRHYLVDDDLREDDARAVSVSDHAVQ